MDDASNRSVVMLHAIPNLVLRCDHRSMTGKNRTHTFTCTNMKPVNVMLLSPMKIRF